MNRNMASRLDTALVQRGLASGREKAKEYIASGFVTVNGLVAKKPAMPVEESDVLVCQHTEKYVGRGGYKLEKALEVSGISLDGVTALDVGASTGGFTDCMLQHGAARVYALDVGHDQLHEMLRNDPRVCNLEGIDIRAAEKIEPFLAKNSVLFCTIDVSFISVKRIFPYIYPFLAQGAYGVCLIKPQFEAGRSSVGRNGIVKDSHAHQRVLMDLCGFFATQGCPIRQLEYSPITGGEGNIEYLAIWEKTELPSAVHTPVEIEQLVQQAHRSLLGKR